MELEGMRLYPQGEISQSEKDKYHMISLMWNKIKKENKEKENKSKLIVTDHRLVVARGEGECREGEMGKGG